MKQERELMQIGVSSNEVISNLRTGLANKRLCLLDICDACRHGGAVVVVDDAYVKYSSDCMVLRQTCDDGMRDSYVSVSF